MWNTRGYTNKVAAQSILLTTAIEKCQIFRGSREDINREDTFWDLGEEARTGSAPRVEIGLRGVERPKVGQVVVQGITCSQHGFAVVKNIPGKADSGTEVVLVHPVKRLLGETDKAARVSLGIVRQEICALIIPSLPERPRHPIARRLPM